MTAPSTFSPDGSASRSDAACPQGRGAIVAANADGSGEEILVALKAPLEIFHPAWSPDGRAVAYTVSGRDDEGYYINIESVGVSDRAPHTVSAARWRDVNSIAWLADGSGLVIAGRDRASLPSTPTQIWFVAYPSGEARKITNDLNGYTNLSLTADSRRAHHARH